MNTQIEFKVSEVYEVGAVLVDSWGWEQTNVDFYAIIKRSGLFVTIQKLKKDETAMDPQSMSSRCAPAMELDETAKPIRKKIKVFSGKESGFSLRDYMGGGWVNLWKGDVQTATHYA